MDPCGTPVVCDRADVVLLAVTFCIWLLIQFCIHFKLVASQIIEPRYGFLNNLIKRIAINLGNNFVPSSHFIYIFHIHFDLYVSDTARYHSSDI